MLLDPPGVDSQLEAIGTGERYSTQDFLPLQIADFRLPIVDLKSVSTGNASNRQLAIGNRKSFILTGTHRIRRLLSASHGFAVKIGQVFWATLPSLFGRARIQFPYSH